MIVRVRLHGWADSLTGDQKVIFAIQLALANAGYGIGYAITFEKKSIDDSHLVTHPWDMTISAATVVSMGYFKGTTTRTTETYKFTCRAESYSVRSIYQAAYSTLRDKRKVHMTRDEKVVEHPEDFS